MSLALTLTLSLVAARPLLVLPVIGVDVTSDELAALAPVDDAVRDAVVGREDVAVLGKEQTLSAVSQARAAGVTCGVSDLSCVKKLAVLSEAELALVPVVAPGHDGTGALVLTLLEVTGPRVPERAAARVPLKGKELDAEAKRLVDEIFTKWREPPPDLDAIASTPAPAPAPAPAPLSADAQGERGDGAARAWIIGGVVGAAVVVGAVVGGVVAWAIGTAPPRPAETGPTP